MITVANNAEFLSAISMAVGGDRIELTAGDYGSLNITGVTFSSDVTIVSADPASPAVVRGLIVSGSSRLVFDGILFDYSGGAVFKPFWVQNSSFIAIRNSVFNGVEVPSGGGSGEFGYGYGLHITDSNNVVIESNEFFDFNRGIVTYRTTNLTIKANDIRSLSSDGMNFVSVDGLLVEGNWIHDFKIDPVSGDHPDMIQFWVVAGETSSRNIIIRGNFFDAGVGDWTETIFMGNGLAGGTFEEYAFRNILIEENVIYNDHAHGITVDETDGLIVRNNTLLHDPYTNNQLGWPPQTRLLETSLNVTIENHITQDVWNWAARTNQPTWTVTNILLLIYDPASPDYYRSMFVNSGAVNATLADLRAVAGGFVEANGLGAAMTRADIDITLLVGPYATESSDPVPEPDTCEALLAEIQVVVNTLEAQLADAQTALALMTDERDVALGDRDTAEAALVSMTTERNAAVAALDAAVAALVTAQAALVAMTAERDTALAERDAAVLAQAAAEAMRDAAVLAQAAAEAALVSMTTERNAAVASLASMTAERDAALAERDAALQSESAALADLETAQTQLAVTEAERDAAVLAQAEAVVDLTIIQAQLVVAVDKLAAINVISGG